jgi:cyclohexanone monooxygenase
MQEPSARENNKKAPVYDAVVVGAGFGGLYALYKLRRLGLSVRVLEKAPSVGGTWYWNSYPGCRCDVESMDYSYSFSEELEQEWEWSERYARQPEILRYLNYVADKFDLRKDLELNTRVCAAHFDAPANRWMIETGDGRRIFAHYLITAVGCLSSRKNPAEEFKGLETFQGDWCVTSDWPKGGVDLTGKRVGVIGTGSTGIQSIPQIAKQAEHVYVFQRTPNFSVPAQNHPLDTEFQTQVKTHYRERRRMARESGFGIPILPAEKSALELSPEEQRESLEKAWRGGGVRIMNAFNDLLTDADSNRIAADFVRAKIREMVESPELAETLCPTDHPIATKRLCIDTEYFETFNRDNVTLVNLRRLPIVEITPNGLRTKEASYDLDVIVFAIGFDAMTGALFDMDIRGRHGLALEEKWTAGPRTYLGLATAGFPNMFIITGPGSPSVLSNMVVSIEQHVDWIADCITYMRNHQLDCIEATVEAENRWVQHVHDVGHATLFPLCPNSWYVGANVPGKPRVFTPYIGGVAVYRQTCDQIAANDYEGFALSRAAQHIPEARPATAAWG